MRKKFSLSVFPGEYELVWENHWAWHNMKKETMETDPMYLDIDISCQEIFKKRFTVQENRKKMCKIDNTQSLLES